MLPEERIVYPGTRLSPKGEDRDPGYMILGPKTSVPTIPAPLDRPNPEKTAPEVCASGIVPLVYT